MNRKILVLLPLYGIFLFFLLYVVAASLYAGGSQVDKTAKGFSLMHNYWCDLLADKAQNDESNAAQPIAISAFLFTNYHDMVINIGGGLGVIALVLTFINLYESKFYKLFFVGILCLILCILNYFIYETKIYLSLLAITQKISFVLFLGWLGVINYCIYKKMQKQAFILRG